MSPPTQRCCPTAVGVPPLISPSQRTHPNNNPLLPHQHHQVGEFDVSKGLPVPHIGWNTLHQARSSELLSSVAPSDRVYFVHSFRWGGGCPGGLRRALG